MEKQPRPLLGSRQYKLERNRKYANTGNGLGRTLSDEEKAEIIRLVKREWRSPASVARQFQVHRSTVHKVLTNNNEKKS